MTSDTQLSNQLPRARVNKLQRAVGEAKGHDRRRCTLQVFTTRQPTAVEVDERMTVSDHVLPIGFPTPVRPLGFCRPTDCDFLDLGIETGKIGDDAIPLWLILPIEEAARDEVNGNLLHKP